MNTQYIFKPKIAYLYNIGDIINNMEILEQTCFIKQSDGSHSKAYKVKCLKCGGISQKTEYQLKEIIL